MPLAPALGCSAAQSSFCSMGFFQQARLRVLLFVFCPEFLKPFSGHIHPAFSSPRVLRERGRPIISISLHMKTTSNLANDTIVSRLS